MGKKKRRQYKGPSMDIQYNPWLRLIHGRHYDTEKTEMSSGKIRLRITDEYETAMITYKDNQEFEDNWC